MLALGVFSLLVAAVAFILYMRTSYVTQGGGLGQVPCVAAATIQVPLMTMLGLGLVGDATGRFNFAWWQWILIWLAQTLCVAAAAVWIGRLAERRARRGLSGSSPPSA